MECLREIEVDVFAATMARFESHFTAGLITTPKPVEHVAGSSIPDLLKKYPDFDQFPVREKGRIVSVLERRAGDSSEPGYTIEPLSDAMMVPSDEPIHRLAVSLEERPYFLVVCGRERIGLVTRSDLLKLPVRLLAFTLITHLEQLMGRGISHKFKKVEQWLVLIDSVKDILERFKQLQNEGNDPDLVQLTQFGHKVTILTKACNLNERSVHELRDIEELRNQIMHGRDYIDSESQLKVFNARIRCAREWIGRFDDYLAGRKFSQPEMKAKHEKTNILK